MNVVVIMIFVVVDTVVDLALVVDVQFAITLTNAQVRNSINGMWLLMLLL